MKELNNKEIQAVSGGNDFDWIVGLCEVVGFIGKGAIELFMAIGAHSTSKNSKCNCTKA